MTAHHKRMIKDYFAAGNVGKTDAQLALLDRDRFALQCHAAAPLGYTKNYAELEAMFGQMGSKMRSFVVDIDQMTAEEDRVAVKAHSTGVTADGKPYCNEYHFLFWFADDRIVKIEEYLCSMTMAKVLNPEIWQAVDQPYNPA